MLQTPRPQDRIIEYSQYCRKKKTTIQQKQQHQIKYYTDLRAFNETDRTL